MRSVESHVPPVVVFRDGEGWVCSTAEIGGDTVEVWSPIGDGAWFMTDAWNKIVKPKLMKVQGRIDTDMADI